MNQDKTKTIILVAVIAVVIVVAAWYFFVSKPREQFAPYQELSPAAREKVFETLRVPEAGAETPNTPVNNEILKLLAPTKKPSVSDEERENVLKLLTPQ